MNYDSMRTFKNADVNFISYWPMCYGGFEHYIYFKEYVEIHKN